MAITTGAEEMPLPSSRIPTHGGVIITSGVEQMLLPHSRIHSNHYILREGNNSNSGVLPRFRPSLSADMALNPEKR
jgi:hypothetical protein